VNEGLNPFEPPKANADADARYRLLPYARIDLLSDWPPGDVLDELDELIEPIRWLRFRLAKPRALFEGTVIESRFDCRFIAHLGNSGISRIRGVVLSHARGSRIRASVSLPRTSILLGGISAFAVVTIGSRLYSETSEVVSFVVPLVGILLGCFMTVMLFRREAQRARQILIGRLEARLPRNDEVGLE